MMAEPWMEEVMKVQAANPDRFTAKVLVKAARSKRSPLHDRFEWDDSVAGEKYREEQARQLIKSVTIEYTDKDGESSSVRGLLPVVVKRVDGPAEDAVTRVYKPVYEVLEDPYTRAQVFAQARKEWAQLEAKYHHLEEFWEMVRKSAA